MTEPKRICSSTGKTTSSSSENKLSPPLRGKSVQIFKVIVIGDSNVGKTCLTFRFCGGSFSEKFEPTIGVDFREKSVTVNEEDIKLQIWDTAGQERFRRSMVQHYYRNVHAVVFVYDVTKIASFESLPHWVEECDRNGLGSNVPRVLVGNKIDLTVKRAVASTMARKFAEFHNMVFYETSAKDNSESDNIETIFMSVAKTLCHLDGYVTVREKDVIDVTVNPMKPHSQPCSC